MTTTTTDANDPGEDVVWFTVGDDPTRIPLLSPDRFTFGESRVLEKVTGFTYGQIVRDEDIQQSTVVNQAILWMSWKRVKNDLRFTDLDDVEVGSITFHEPPSPEDAEDAPETATSGRVAGAPGGGAPDPDGAGVGAAATP